jgi:surface antigen
MASVGHVGWVTAVNGSHITVSEMNFVRLGVTDTATYTVQQGRAPDGLPVMQFILAP